jgi:hypothetical protein
MAMSDIRLVEITHPTRECMKEFDGLVGIDAIKEALTDELAIILDRKRLAAWRKRHHAAGLGVLDDARPTVPLILLSGDVGCGRPRLPRVWQHRSPRPSISAFFASRHRPISAAGAMSANSPPG